MIKYGPFAIETDHIDEEGVKQKLEVSVIELVCHELEKDDLIFTNPLYNKIHQLILEGLAQNIFYKPSHFLKLQDQEEIEWFDRKKKLQEEEEKLQVEKKQGFVYCFSNTHVEDLYKIGLTQKLTPDGRAKQLRGTGQIGKWQVEFAKKVRDCRKTEKVLHATFKKYHVDKEMFKVKDIDEIRKEFDLLQGEWYNPHNTQKITSHFNNL